MTGPIHQDFEARATSNPDEVEKLWQGAPNALVGLPCSRNNVTVLHARGGQGIQSLNRLAARHGCFLSRCEGGEHAVWRYRRPFQDARRRLGMA